MADATGIAAAQTLEERARAARDAATKRAQVARVRVSLFSERDGGVAAARERYVHLEAVARRADHALARVAAGADAGANAHGDPRALHALHAHVTVGDARLGGVATATTAVLDARAFDTTRQLTHALPPGVFAALPIARATHETTATKRVSSSVRARRESYADAVAKDVQDSIVAQAQRLAIAAP